MEYASRKPAVTGVICSRRWGRELGYEDRARCGDLARSPAATTLSPTGRRHVVERVSCMACARHGRNLTSGLRPSILVAGPLFTQKW